MSNQQDIKCWKLPNHEDKYSWKSNLQLHKYHIDRNFIYMHKNEGKVHTTNLSQRWYNISSSLQASTSACALMIDSILERSFLLRLFLLFSVYESFYMGTLSILGFWDSSFFLFFPPYVSFMWGCWCVYLDCL
jgi:hypothetical protein